MTADERAKLLVRMIDTDVRKLGGPIPHYAIKDEIEKAEYSARRDVDIQAMVGKFRHKMGLASRLVPDLKVPAMRDEYEHLDYLLEEIAEFSRALRHRSFPGAVDALADMIYYAYGTAHRWGVDLRPIMALVHAANMLKEPDKIVAGKLIKPPGWQPPDVGALLIEQGWQGEKP